MPRYVIELDLNRHPDLYNKLIEIAQSEMRSVNNQVIYWLYKHIDDYMGFDKREEKKK